jgi:transposase
MPGPSSISCQAGEAPDARAARDSKGHFNQAFKLAAVRYALGCGKSQRAAARDMGIGDKTLGGWVSDARPAHPGAGKAGAAAVADVEKFDELARLRAQTRELLAANGRLTAERDFLKKAAAYFAAPSRDGSK